MKTKLFILLIGIFASLWSFGQNQSLDQAKLFRMMEDPNINYYMLKRYADEYFRKYGTERGSGYKQYKRFEYELRFHINRDGSRISAAEDWNAFSNYMSAARHALTAGSWTELGPAKKDATSAWNPGVGRLTCIAIDPQNANTIYVGSPGGGCWKSINGGATWSCLTDNLPVLDVYSLAIDPSNTSVIYMGTNGGGLLKSTNGGGSWTKLTGTPDAYNIRRIIINPSNTSIVLAALGNGVYRSTNGSSFSQVSTFYSEDLEFKPGNPSIVYASGDAVFKSTNGGQSFTPVTSGIPTTGRTHISVTPANPEYVYVVQAKGSEFGYLYRSTNSGTSFTTRVVGDPANGTNYFGYSTTGTSTGGQAGYDMAMCVSPLNANEVHIGGIQTWKSTNGGSSFSITSDWYYPSNTIGYNHADIHALEFAGSVLYSGSDGGIYKSTNNADDWTDLSAGLGIRQFYRLSCAATNDTIISGGAQDNGTSIRKASGWIDWLGADGGETIIDYTNPNIIYGSTQFGNSLHKTTDGGNSFSYIGAPAGNGAWIIPWVIHPSDHNTLFIAYNDLYKTTDGGGTWTQISDFSSSGIAINLAIAPSNPNYIYVTKGQLIFRTKNGGTTWTQLDNVGAYINSLTVNPNNPEKIVVALAYGTQQILKSTNAGDTWTDISGTLPIIGATSIVYHNGPEEGMYLAMRVGVYYRDNNLSDWIPFMNNLPKVFNNELEIHYQSGKIRAATYGRGMWESPLYLNTGNNPPVVSITSPVNGAIYNTPATVTIQANASDNDGNIRKVEFYSGTVLLGSDTTSPYSYNWSNVPIGTYSLTAKAYDNLNASTSSSPVSITVKSVGNTPPTVSITSPANGAVFTAPVNVTVTAAASDSDGSIYKVEFYRGTSWIGTDYNSPYTVVWNFQTGTHSITAKAFDNQSASSTSAPITITVKPPYGVAGNTISQHTEIYLDGLVTAYPNPFDSNINFAFKTLQEGKVILKIYNQLGNELMIVDENRSKGEQVVDFDGKQLASGIYFYELRLGDEFVIGKLIKH